MSGILIFEVVLIALTIGIYFIMKKYEHKKIFLKMLILFIAVLFFEVMSEPMWRNNGLDSWAYLYHDVSWIITLGWVNIFLVSIILVDIIFKKYSEIKKFGLYLLFVTVITTPIEVILFSSGIRSYAVELTSTMSGVMIPFTSAPIEIIAVIPMIAALVVPFYKTCLRIFKVD